MSATAAAPAETGRYQVIDIGSVFASKTNPRTHFDDVYIGELAGSIKEKGLIQPIVVRPRPKSGINGTVEIIAGECRYRASKQAGLTHVPVIVRDMTDDQVLEAQLEENIHRKDLTDLEESDGLIEYWRARLPEGERRTIEAILTYAPGAEVERERIDGATGYKRSSRDAYLTRLKARGLVEFSGRGTVRASAELFS